MKAVSTSNEADIRDPTRGDSPASSLLDCHTAFQRIAKKCVHLVRSNRGAAIAADPDAIHTMRMELTRLRAAVLFFSPMVKDTAWAPIRNELRWLNAALYKAKALSLLGKGPSAPRLARAAQGPSDRRRYTPLGPI
jgi:inorganic triphosphatase YgiF